MADRVSKFDSGYGVYAGSIQSITLNDKINKFTMRVGRSSITDGISTSNGRKIRGAIWIVKEGALLSSKPDFESDNTIDTSDIKLDTLQDVTFIFSSAKVINATKVILGFTSSDVAGNVVFESVSGKDLLVKPYLYSTTIQTMSSSGIRFTSIDITHYASTDSPKLSVSNIIVRTLSEYYSGSAPDPNLDSNVINSSSLLPGNISKQWNTTRSNHPYYTFRGFDISPKQDCGLSDITYSGISDSHNPSRSSYYWVFNRSRILIQLNQCRNNGTKSVIAYNIKENKNKTVYYQEITEFSNTLLVCPRDEGIGDNEQMTVSLQRHEYSRTASDAAIKNGTAKPIVSSNPIDIYFYTFTKPEVHIAYPKNLNSGGNYVLWANEIINDSNSEDRNASKQICSALNILLTKDGGDNSNIPMFTRLFIEEYEGSYSNNGTFPTPSNSSISDGSALSKQTATWRAILLDDGTIFQVSGMRTNGHVWDKATGHKEDTRIYFRSGYKYRIKARRFHGAAAGWWSDNSYLYEDDDYPGYSGTNYAPISNYKSIIESNNLASYSKKWVGPYDGDVGNNTYPGFSESEEIIIDCCNVMTSTLDIVTPRPAVQEIGADHWISFAYRHLNKTPEGIDVSHYNIGNRRRLTASSRTQLNADGSVNPMKPDASNVFGKTWSGQDNTATRIAKMYKKMIEETVYQAYKYYRDNMAELPCNDGETDKRTPKSAKLIVALHHNGIEDYENVQTVCGLNPWGGTNGNYVYYYDSSFVDTNNGTAKPGCYQSYMKTFINGYTETGSTKIPEGYHPEYEIISGIALKDDQKLYNLGNQYNWVPVIGNNTVNSNMKTKTTVNPYWNGNYGKASFEKGSNYAPCTEFGINVIENRGGYPDQYAFIAKSSDTAPVFTNEFKEWNTQDNKDNNTLYTSKGEDTNNISHQLFGSEINISSRETQLKPGLLYKAIPADLDCECGKNTDRIAVPTRKDAKYPLTRSTHMLYYKTSIFGAFTFALVVEYDIHEAQYTTNEETGEQIYTRCIHVGTETKQYTPEGGTSAPVIADCGYSAAMKTGEKLAGKSVYNILTVYDEDNGGMGRCLSADNSTAMWFDSSCNPKPIVSESSPSLDGGIEIPLRVRFTPLAQPIISNNTQIVGSAGNNYRTIYTNNMITLEKKGGIVQESNSKPQRTDGTAGKESFSVAVSYGMYRSAMAGSYKTTQVKASDYTLDYYKLTNNEIGTTEYNTDIYPSVGICNCFMAILVPNDAKRNGASIDYTKFSPNWFSSYNNIESLTSTSNKTAKAVIVADMLKDTIYQYSSMTGLESFEEDHRLRTAADIVFNYKTLLYYNDIQGTTRKRSNLLKTKLWYDLIVVPIFTNENGFASTMDSGINFKYDGKACLINENSSGGGTSSTVSYYGSTPLVVRKFLQIAEVKEQSGGGGGVTPGEPEIIKAPFNTQAVILYPNVNNVRFGEKIKETPGFWLDNTFRVVIRGPHYRDSATIKDTLPSGKTTSEISLESITGGELSSQSESNDYTISDLMIHFGKYDDYVKQYDEASQSFIDYRFDYINDKGELVSNVSATFDSDEFQRHLNDNSLNTQLLNSLGIYTMRTNPEAFSKCVPDNKKSGDTRDLITGGSLSPNDSKYYNRLVEFNPSIVNVKTPYPEGYYIQVRYLNNEYKGTSQAGMWSAWCGFIKDDSLIDERELTIGPNHREADDEDFTSLTTYVPTRNYQEILTGFRNFMKESTPGTYLRDLDETTRKMNVVEGAGTYKGNMTSPVKEIPADNQPYIIIGSGNSDDATILTEDDIDFPYNPQIWSQTYDDTQFSDKEKFPYITKSQSYLEINYVDYIIRNMAKLYYAECRCSLYNQTNFQLYPVDIGWTAALAYAYPEVAKNNNRKWNESSVITEVSTIKKNTFYESVERPEPIEGQPLNRNRYFRKDITSKDFNILLDIIKKIAGFLRDTKITGTINQANDVKDDSGYGTGYGVLPISPELLEFDKLYENRMVIGHSIMPNVADHTNDKNNFYKEVDCNYIQQIMTAVTRKLAGR